MSKPIIKIVEFELEEGVTTESLVSAEKKAEGFFSSLPGFVKRYTAKGEGGLWVDISEWEDMVSAEEASSQFAEAEETQGLMKIINLETIRVQHFEIENTMSNEKGGDEKSG